MEGCPQPTMDHPITGVRTWFHHGTFFHVTTLDPKVAKVLMACMPEEDLPSNTYEGDGAPFTAEEMEYQREAYRAEMVLFPWQKGDLLLLDNMLTAHARAPYKGDRKILVGMAGTMDRKRIFNAKTLSCSY